ncbi:MAG: RNA polymerase sigma factor [Phycisphaerales bacterium]
MVTITALSAVCCQSCGVRYQTESEVPPLPSSPSISLPIMPDQDTRTDEELIEAYRGGESGAFPVLIERYHDDLLRFLVRLTGSRATAEDAFQETFLQVHLSADAFDVNRRLKPWLFTIAANKARDALRKNSRRRALDLSAPINNGGGGRGGPGGGGDQGGRTFVDLLEIDIPPPSGRMEDEEQSKQVQQALDALPWSLREILLLAYFQRMSYSQIADSLDIPLGTVKSRLHAAVAAFAKKWQATIKGKKPV